LQGAEDVALVGGEFGALVDLAGVAGELSDVQGLEFLADARRLVRVGIWFSAIRMSSSASQHSRTCARIRASLRWLTGRSRHSGARLPTNQLRPQPTNRTRAASTGLAADATVVNNLALSAQRVLGQSLPRP